MTSSAEDQRHPVPPSVQLIPAGAEHKPVLANLLELYIHDFSEFHPLHVDESGRFGYPRLPLYWQEADRHPFLLRVDDKLAGLVLVQRVGNGPGETLSAGETFGPSESGVWEIAEFFVLRRFRRLKAGTIAAHAVWRLFPGPWQVRVMQSNQAAHGFWKSAVASFAGEAIQTSRIEKDGETWTVFRFRSKLDGSET